MTKETHLETCIRLAIGNIREANRYLTQARHAAVDSSDIAAGEERELYNVMDGLEGSIDILQCWADSHDIPLRISMKT